MEIIFNKKRILVITFFLFMLTIAVSLFAKGNEIEYDLFNVEIFGQYCENCASNSWHVDIPDDNPYHPGHTTIAFNDHANIKALVVVLPVLNLRCGVCYSEFHFDRPVEMECKL